MTQPPAPPPAFGFDNLSPGFTSTPVLAVYGEAAYAAVRNSDTGLYGFAAVSLPPGWPPERDSELATHFRSLARRTVVLWAEDGAEGKERALRHARQIANAGAAAVGLLHPGFQPSAYPPLTLKQADMAGRAKAALTLAQARALPNQGRLSGRAVAPDPTPVDAQLLLSDTRALIARFLGPDPKFSLTLALWCLHAWCGDDTTMSPRLILKGGDARAEHAKALRLIAWLTPHPRLIARASANQLLAAFGEHRPTLLLDDVTGGLLYRRDMRTLLAAGAHADATFMAGTHYAKPIACACPAAIATGAALPDDLAARAIVVPMLPPAASAPREPIAYDKPPPELPPLRARIHTFARHAGTLPAVETPHETWRALLRVATLIGGTALEEAAQALQQLTRADPLPRSNLALLSDIAALFTLGDGVRIPTAQLIERLIGDPELPWASANRGYRLSARALAERLGHFGVRPTTFRQADGAIVRGYMGCELKDAIGRFLPFHDAA